jgi:pantothenate kinase
VLLADQQLAPVAALVPMDGYHYDNAVLEARGLLKVKGAPATFNADGLASDLQRIRTGDRDVAVPVFDRDEDLAHANASIVAASARIVLVEGNYLLLDEEPWRGMARLFDLTVMLTAPFAELERRLVQRWLDQGLPPQAARERALGNDIPNARIVVDRSRKAGIEVATA